MTVQEYRKIQTEKERYVFSARAHNENEWTKFFMSVYEIENDAYCPMKVEEAFPGIDIPDIRKPGNSLKELFPHYFTGVPSSAEAKAEFLKLKDIYMKVDAIATQMAQRAEELCKQ